ncbi:hypothetical protein Ahy_B05g076138 [Arachis hypogaea]|uniref:Aminotransferase-like plant mobile domain-containing protein n=1 Tax=Arachis hypogaea TaxID=3818 RepID=A0A444Z2M6_ARAHY|nr:hypothetical protein Ahy_B05g076138 [Arachis hypogaea]
MEDERRLYRLDGVAHVAGTIDAEPVFFISENAANPIPAWEWFEELFGELPPPDKRKLYTVHFTWFHERFRVLPADALEETVHIYAHAYIMMLLSTQLFMDKSANRVHLR